MERLPTRRSPVQIWSPAPLALAGQRVRKVCGPPVSPTPFVLSVSQVARAALWQVREVGLRNGGKRDRFVLRAGSEGGNRSEESVAERCRSAPVRPRTLLRLARSRLRLVLLRLLLLHFLALSVVAFAHGVLLNNDRICPALYPVWRY